MTFKSIPHPIQHLTLPFVERRMLMGTPEFGLLQNLHQKTITGVNGLIKAFEEP